MFSDVLNRLGIGTDHPGVYAGEWLTGTDQERITSINPATEAEIGRVEFATRDLYDRCIETAQVAQRRWQDVPAPLRGELVRQFGDTLRRHKDDLGLLVTLESGKILSEGRGEIQEMIDMCDFATGLSRQLYGLTMTSERPGHRMFEQWHPLGTVGVITAFNFPAAVWAWNAAIAWVCGNAVVWKPSARTPLTSIAIQSLVHQVLAPQGHSGISGLCLDREHEVGKWMAEDRRLPLISATGSTAMGQAVAQTVARRLGRSLLELGGNNAIIVAPSANIDLALRAVLFAAVGTAGQRCTTLRRLILHRSIAGPFLERLVSAYQTIRPGNPWEDSVLLGPVINQQSVDRLLAAVQRACQEGGQLLCGGVRLDRPGYFFAPTIIRVTRQSATVCEETFGPLLYVLTYDELDEAIAIHNAVPQGLSSAIFSEQLSETERFLSARGSDCGIANVNIGTSGAEIGGAFGGEKDTGGGREAGSDSWKVYMRRQTCTINWGGTLPLAQGVRFDLHERT